MTTDEILSEQMNVQTIEAIHTLLCLLVSFVKTNMAFEIKLIFKVGKFRLVILCFNCSVYMCHPVFHFNQTLMVINMLGQVVKDIVCAV